MIYSEARYTAGFFIPSRQKPHNALWAHGASSCHHATPQNDHACTVTLAQPHADKINVSQTKTALHRTRLRFLDHKNFSVFIFYESDSQPVPVLAALRKT